MDKSNTFSLGSILSATNFPIFIAGVGFVIVAGTVTFLVGNSLFNTEDSNQTDPERETQERQEFSSELLEPEQDFAEEDILGEQTETDTTAEDEEDNAENESTLSDEQEQAIADLAQVATGGSADNSAETNADSDNNNSTSANNSEAADDSSDSSSDSESAGDDSESSNDGDAGSEEEVFVDPHPAFTHCQDLNAGEIRYISDFAPLFCFNYPEAWGSSTLDAIENNTSLQVGFENNQNFIVRVGYEPEVRFEFDTYQGNSSYQSSSDMVNERGQIYKVRIFDNGSSFTAIASYAAGQEIYKEDGIQYLSTASNSTDALEALDRVITESANITAGFGTRDPVMSCNNPPTGLQTAWAQTNQVCINYDPSILGDPSNTVPGINSEEDINFSNYPSLEIKINTTSSAAPTNAAKVGIKEIVYANGARFELDVYDLGNGNYRGVARHVDNSSELFDNDDVDVLEVVYEADDPEEVRDFVRDRVSLLTVFFTYSNPERP